MLVSGLLEQTACESGTSRDPGALLVPQEVMHLSVPILAGARRLFVAG